MEVKGRVVQEFNSLVETENTINRIRVAAAAPAPAAAPSPAASAPGAPAAGPAPAAEERFHVVEKGDTLSGLALKYYGKAGLYMKIFEANRDILKDPNLIKIGQKLRIPK